MFFTYDESMILKFVISSLLRELLNDYGCGMAFGHLQTKADPDNEVDSRNER